ncbi:uncharacterized protein LOC134528932 [Bacillus rossius redtenbacheri]|uniref:uncharacterized protein LOC134528932 n=1 Tax=Bacillus rossius redtenbacheri TaxID=93214 RepID=UPI002FDD8AD3
MSRIVFYVADACQASVLLREGVILARPAVKLTEAEPPFDSRRLPVVLYLRLRPRVHQMLRYDGERPVYFEFQSQDVWAVKDSCGPGCARWLTAQNIFLFSPACGCGKGSLRALFL